MAEPAHKAAMAADLQGKFWEFHDKLFSAKKLTNELIESTAKELNLDLDKFHKDLNSPVVLQKIRKDMVDAQNAGVTGTPTVFINGRKLTERSLQSFQKLIDEEVANAGK